MDTREIIDNDGSKYGIVGDITPLLYEDGTHMQVGDTVVNTINDNCKCGETFIVEKDGHYYSMGIRDYSLDGKIRKGWTLVPSRKYWEVEVDSSIPIIEILIADSPDEIGQQ